MHLKGEGYSIITNKLIQEAKRLSTNKQVCRSNPSATERNRKRDNSLSSGGVCKKQRLHHHPAARGLSGGFNGGRQGLQRDHNRDTTGTLPAQEDTTTEVAVAVEAGEIAEEIVRIIIEVEVVEKSTYPTLMTRQYLNLEVKH